MSDSKPKRGPGRPRKHPLPEPAKAEEPKVEAKKAPEIVTPFQCFRCLHEQKVEGRTYFLPYCAICHIPMRRVKK